MSSKFNNKNQTGLLLSVSIGTGVAIGTAEKNVPAGIMFAAAFVIIFSLLKVSVKQHK